MLALGKQGIHLCIPFATEADTVVRCSRLTPNTRQYAVTPQNRYADVLGDEFIILRARKLKILYVGVQYP